MKAVSSPSYCITQFTVLSVTSCPVELEMIDLTSSILERKQKANDISAKEVAIVKPSPLSSQPAAVTFPVVLHKIPGQRQPVTLPSGRHQSISIVVRSDQQPAIGPELRLAATTTCSARE